MPSFAVISIAMLPMLGPAFATQAAAPPVQPGGRIVASPAVTGFPVGVQLATLADHADTLAGQFVVLPPVRVSRVVSPGLVELRDAREKGPYKFNLGDKRDRVLARLPAGATVAAGDYVVVTGIVATVRGAGVTGQLDDTAAGERVRRRGNEPLLLVNVVTTGDGVSLAGAR